jgi:hypothetical protein
MLKRLLISLLLVSNSVEAAELTYQFKSPSFNGVGTSSHWLTIENQETSRQKAIQDKLEAALKAKATAEANSILNRFMNNLQSRIYSQISQQIATNLFSGSNNTSGTFELEGNKITYEKTTDTIVLKIVDSTGAITELTVPIGQFSF